MTHIALSAFSVNIVTMHRAVKSDSRASSYL